jgi:nicotinamide-nucleotide amidase
MKAEIIAVGTELLMGHVVNTNAAEIAEMLGEIGIGTFYHTVVGDNEHRLADVVSTAVGRADVVIMSGGLGPTEDDLTRETVAEVLRRPLQRDESWVRHLEELFARRGWGPTTTYALPQNNYRQAMVPEGAELLPNDRGTAPGIWLEHDIQGRTVLVALVPGPPREMRGLMAGSVIPRLREATSARGASGMLASRVLRVIGLGESRVAELLADSLAEQTNPTIAPLAQTGEMVLRITAHGTDRTTVDRLLSTTAEKIYAVLGDAIYGEDGETLESVIGGMLGKRGLTIATAESCTGGLVGHRITNVPGSSSYFLGGVVSYSNEAKSDLIGVDPRLIEEHGAVSEAVAKAMAVGAAKRFGTDYAVAITGIAGPDGGTPEKPVGLTYIAVVGPDSPNKPSCTRYTFGGEREIIKWRASHAALDLVRRSLLRYTHTESEVPRE